jgi:hypothetical protein
MYKEGVPDNKAVSVELGKKAELKKVMKRVMPFVAFVKEKVAASGLSALDTSLPWDERTVLESNKDYIGQILCYFYRARSNLTSFVLLMGREDRPSQHKDYYRSDFVLFLHSKIKSGLFCSSHGTGGPSERATKTI